MLVTLTRLDDPCAVVTVTWDDDGDSYSYVALGRHDILALEAAGAFEGADVDGYSVECRWT